MQAHYNKLFQKVFVFYFKSWVWQATGTFGWNQCEKRIAPIKYGSKGFARNEYSAANFGSKMTQKAIETVFKVNIVYF